MNAISVCSMAALLLVQSIVNADKPDNIVSLDLCTDWMLLTYASPGQVRAYSNFLYQYPNDSIAQGLPTHDGSLEQIVSLKPGLIISGEFNALLLRERLRQLGFTTGVLSNPRSLDDIKSYIQQVKQLLKVETAATTELHPASYPARKQSLLLLGPNGVGTGLVTLENDIINAAGWDNYLTLSGYVPLQLEQLVSDPPDAIFWARTETHSIAAQFAQHPALRRKIVDTRWNSSRSWRWQCPGPWSYQLIQELARWKNP